MLNGRALAGHPSRSPPAPECSKVLCPLQAPWRSEPSAGPHRYAAASVASKDTEVQRCVRSTFPAFGSQWPLGLPEVMYASADQPGSPRSLCWGFWEFPGLSPVCLKCSLFSPSRCPSSSLPANPWEGASVPSPSVRKLGSLRAPGPHWQLALRTGTARGWGWSWGG